MRKRFGVSRPGAVGVHAAVAAVCIALTGQTAVLRAAQEKQQAPQERDASAKSSDAAPGKALELPPPPAEKGDPAPADWKRLAPEKSVWLDTKHKRVIIDGQVALREGPLEMFACLKGTKEHESIVAVDTEAYVVHAALLAAGAEAGTPVEFRPEYQPPTGTKIEVFVVWRDEQGKSRQAHAQDWIRNMETMKPMEEPFVFAGSSFWTDPDTGKKYYQAEGGDFICVANFPSAMLDVPVPSSQSNTALVYEALTERIPPRETKVRLVLVPKKKENAKPGEEAGSNTPVPSPRPAQ